MAYNPKEYFDALRETFGADAVAALPAQGVDLLINDLHELDADERLYDPQAAARILSTRIGGVDNLPSYTDCLIAGARFRAGHFAMPKW